MGGRGWLVLGFAACACSRLFSIVLRCAVLRWCVLLYVVVCVEEGGSMHRTRLCVYVQNVPVSTGWHHAHFLILVGVVPVHTGPF